jgi:hypothetical protein
VAALIGTYAGLKIVLGAAQAVATLRIALGGLTAAHAAAGAAATAQAAAEARLAAATNAAAISLARHGKLDPRVLYLEKAAAVKAAATPPLAAKPLRKPDRAPVLD